MAFNRTLVLCWFLFVTDGAEASVATKNEATEEMNLF